MNLVGKGHNEHLLFKNGWNIRRLTSLCPGPLHDRTVEDEWTSSAAAPTKRVLQVPQMPSPTQGRRVVVVVYRVEATTAPAESSTVESVGVMNVGVVCHAMMVMVVRWGT